MQTLNAISLTTNVTDWLTNSRRPRVLHVFDNACNLINENREVLSIVTPQIGNGPFNLVIPRLRKSSEVFANISLESPISISPNSLTLGTLAISTASAKIWNPRPDWEALNCKKDDITQLLIANYRPPILQFPNSLLSESLVSSLSSSFISADISSAKTITTKLAGLGQGLPPSGDDFIMGALYAAWILHPLDVAKRLAEEVASVAIPLTTSLSGAWINSASKGEAGELWHVLFNSLIHRSSNLESSISDILVVGETPGADAMSGFLGTMLYWADEKEGM